MRLSQSFLVIGKIHNVSYDVLFQIEIWKEDKISSDCILFHSAQTSSRQVVNLKETYRAINYVTLLLQLFENYSSYK